jgi:hypothetical protein
MPEDKKQEPMIDVGEQEGAEINLDENNEQTKAVAEEKIEVQQEEEKPTIESKEENVEEKKTEFKKDGLEEYSDGVKKRIAKLTHKMREAERQREEAIAFAQSLKREKEIIESKLTKTDEKYVSEFDSRVKTNLAAARLALKAAIDTQNVDAQVAAQEQIASLTLDAARLNALKASQEEMPKQKEVTITPQQNVQAPKADPKAEDWASKNSWFGNDSAMTYTAFDIHKQLVEEEGVDPQSNEYYDEIDKRIRLEFPHKFATKETITTERAKPAQTVASAKRPSQTGRKKTVRLTPSQVAIAKRLGVPLEEYAKHLTTKEV